MAAEDVANALMARDDNTVRRAVVDGDFSGLVELDLDDHERELLRGAAIDSVEDVEGHLNAPGGW